MLYKYACQMARQLENRIKKLENQLKILPEGKLYCARDGQSFKWYQHTDKKNIYLGKKQRHLAEMLAKKKYLTLLKDDLTHEKRAVDFYLRHHQTRPWKSEQFLIEKPQYQQFLHQFLKPSSVELQEWVNAPYLKNNSHPQHLIHNTPGGINVRSKSEALIAMVLYNNQIPFRYECALNLGDVTFYPDFTILHPETKEIFYWEHFGIMDSSTYSQKTFQKLQTYSMHNIYPTIQLITTYETKAHPLTLETIDKIVKDYFQ